MIPEPLNKARYSWGNTVLTAESESTWSFNVCAYTSSNEDVMPCRARFFQIFWTVLVLVVPWGVFLRDKNGKTMSFSYVEQKIRREYEFEEKGEEVEWESKRKKR